MDLYDHDPVLSQRIGRASWFARSAGWLVMGGAIGAAVGCARPQIDGPVHYEMILAWPALILLSLLLIWSLRRVLMWKSFEYLSVGMVCLWGGFLLGCDLLLAITDPTYPSFWGFALLHAALGIGVGAVLLGVWRIRYPIKRGPYCPRCGYCLVGSVERMCSECGRAFSLQELGVSSDELVGST